MKHSEGMTQDRIKKYQEYMEQMGRFFDRAKRARNKRDMKQWVDAINTIVGQIQTNVFHELTDKELGYNLSVTQKKTAQKSRRIKV